MAIKSFKRVADHALTGKGAASYRTAVMKADPQDTWLDQDGQLWRIVDMADQHIINALRYLQRKAEARMHDAQREYVTKAMALPRPRLDTEDAFKARCYEVLGEPPVEWMKFIMNERFYRLADEALRRGLQWQYLEAVQQ